MRNGQHPEAEAAPESTRHGRRPWKRIGPHEWKFPESAWEISERFYTGC